jgi:hypothetical protein
MTGLVGVKRGATTFFALLCFPGGEEQDPLAAAVKVETAVKLEPPEPAAPAPALRTRTATRRRRRR